MNFNECFEIVVGVEGGYVNDPDDPGGETKFGISKKSYPNIDIENLTLEEAKIIYKNDYWNLSKCSELPQLLRLAVFDCAVNQGVEVSTELLQEALRVKKDGILGPQTLAAVERVNPEHLLLNYLGHRSLRYTSTNKFNKYGLGWLIRPLRVCRLSRDAPKYAFVNANLLNLRTGGNIKNDVLATLKKGTLLQVEKEELGWTKVSFTGWVVSKYLKA